MKDNNNSSKKRILLYVHFNKKNLLSRHVIYQLKSIIDIFDKIIFISNSKINVEDKELLNGLYDLFLERENIGYDFAAWRDGIKEIGWNELEKYDSVTLMNDTCFGPIYPLDEIYTKMEKSKIDFWGLTSHPKLANGMPGTNGPIPEHIQSYFTVFNKNVVKSGVFKGFFEKMVENHTDVKKVIQQYETQLTKKLEQGGFTYTTFFTQQTGKKQKIKNKAYNLAELRPIEIIEAGVPLVKVKAFTHTFPYRIINYIKKKSDYPTNLIFTHLFKMRIVRFRSLIACLFPVKYLKHTHNIFLLFAIPIILVFINLNPPMFGMDEQYHIARTYQISQGNAFPSINEELPVGLYNYLLENSPRPPVYFDSEPFDTRSDKITASTSPLAVSSSTAIYSPLAYIPGALAMKIISYFNATAADYVFWAKIFQASAYLAFIYLSLWLVRDLRLRWLVLVVALLPTPLYQASTITADTFTIGTCFLFSAVLLKILINNKKNRIDLVILLLSSILMFFTKTSYVLLLLLLLAIPDNLISYRRSYALLAKLGIIISGIVVATLLILNERKLNLPDIYALSDRGIYPSEQIEFILSNPSAASVIILLSIITYSLHWTAGSIITLGYNPLQVGGYQFGNFIFILSIINLVFASTFAENFLSKVTHIKKLLFIPVIFTGLSIVILLYIGFTPVGASLVEGVQPRYFTPLILLTMYLFTHFNFYTLESKPNLNPSRSIIVLTATSLTVLVISYIISVRAY